MTVETETSRSGPYAGAGTTGPFTVGFRFLADSHLQVIKTDSDDVDTTLALTTDYTVAGAGDPTGTVTLVVALAVGEQLTIIRDVPFTQEADYVDNDSFPAESHEQALDLLTMQTQQVKEANDRALTLPATVSGVSTELPAPVADNLIGWDASATALTNVPIASLATSIIGNTYVVETFDGDGVTTNFVLATDPGGTNPVFCHVGGVEQTPGIDFAISGLTASFLTGAPPSGTDNVVFKYGTAVTTVGVASSVSGQTAIGTALITAASAAAARATLGGTTVGAAIFTAVSEAAARTALAFTSVGNALAIAADAAAARLAIGAAALVDVVLLTGSQTIAGVKTFSSMPVLPTPSMVRLNTANGYGSVNANIRRFSNVVTNQGADITYADSATLGASFTINTNGVYAVSYTDSFTVQTDMGVSKNSSQLSTSIHSITVADRLTYVTTSTSNFAGCAAGVFALSAGDVIRPHVDVNGIGGRAALFTITRIV